MAEQMYSLDRALATPEIMGAIRSALNTDVIFPAQEAVRTLARDVARQTGVEYAYALPLVAHELVQGALGIENVALAESRSMGAPDEQTAKTVGITAQELVANPYRQLLLVAFENSADAAEAQIVEVSPGWVQSVKPKPKDV